MKVCNDCLAGFCEESHLSNSFEVCGKCGDLKETWQCLQDKEWKMEAKTLDQVQQDMLTYLHDLARQLRVLNESQSIASAIASLECAGEMCRIAGIRQAVVAEAISIGQEDRS